MSDLAQQIADRLLTDGGGEIGTRLAIKQKLGTGKERDLGGWCRQAIIDQIQPLIEAETKRLREALEEAQLDIRDRDHTIRHLAKGVDFERTMPNETRPIIRAALASAEQQNTNKG